MEEGGLMGFFKTPSALPRDQGWKKTALFNTTRAVASDGPGNLVQTVSPDITLRITTKGTNSGGAEISFCRYPPYPPKGWSSETEISGTHTALTSPSKQGHFRPALYLPGFGVRTEINLFVEEHGARVTGKMQNEFVTL